MGLNERVKNEINNIKNNISLFCNECDANASCGGNHVYVIELMPEASSHFSSKTENEFVYVGETGKHIAERLEDNFKTKINKNGDLVFIRKGKNVNKIRKFFYRMRPDLIPKGLNPLPDRETAEFEEAKLADSLREKGYRVGGPSLKKIKNKIIL
ncbi:MAG: hypothetical protein CMQ51_04065 [Gammaproteobacteria bacterium]|nr:hypothetical protein [Gammaproteobacteria bacterium]|tara:strand:+ start:1458 stop:1922 length:465 start_codon:yes stop_codon:yes gene_type:complete